MLPNQRKQTSLSLWGGVLLALALLACGAVLTFAYAQSGKGGAFSLNSPVSFPVDI